METIKNNTVFMEIICLCGKSLDFKNYFISNFNVFR